MAVRQAPRPGRRPGARRGPRTQRPLAALVAITALLAGCLGTTEAPASPTGVAVAPTATPIASPTVTPTDTPTAIPTAAPIPISAIGPCPGTDVTPGRPAGRLITGTSSNWSGYVSGVTKSGVTCVEGSWVEPTITCPKRGHQAVAIWIGIDGFISQLLGINALGALVQIGTQAECRNGLVQHAAWHEVLPAQQHEMPTQGEVEAGDHISARILLRGGRYLMSISDAETGLDFSISQTAPGAVRKSAEWIVEAPAAGCPDSCTIIALPHFSAIRFTNAHVTIAGSRAAINDDRWTAFRLSISRRGILRTSATALFSSGTSFKVTWLHA